MVRVVLMVVGLRKKGLGRDLLRLMLIMEGTSSRLEEVEGECPIKMKYWGWEGFLFSQKNNLTIEVVMVIVDPLIGIEIEIHWKASDS